MKLGVYISLSMFRYANTWMLMEWNETKKFYGTHAQIFRQKYNKMGFFRCSCLPLSLFILHLIFIEHFNRCITLLDQMPHNRLRLMIEMRLLRIGQNAQKPRMKRIKYLSGRNIKELLHTYRYCFFSVLLFHQLWLNCLNQSWIFNDSSQHIELNIMNGTQLF